MQTVKKAFKMNKWSWRRRYSREKLIEGLPVDEYTVWANGKEAYKFFKKTRPRIKRLGKVNKALYSKVVNEFYKKVAHYLVNCSEGVHIEGLGYFGSMIYSDKVTTSKPFYHEEFEVGVPLINSQSDGKAYCICFVHDKYKPLTRTFISDYTFSNTVKKEFSQALMNGKKYRFNATLFI